VDEDLLNPATELHDDIEAAIGAIIAIGNPTINNFDVKFDEDLLTND